LDCVIAIGTLNEKGEKRWTASGFLYGSLIPQRTEKDEKLYTTYLVSNRHVFEKLDTAYMRVNPKEAKPPTDYELQLKDATSKKWFAHPDPNVDVAIFPVSTRALKQEGMQVAFFENDEITATRSNLSDLGVSEGDFVYTLGFPMGLVGEERNFVIVRQGIIARIRDALANPEQNYLIDAFIFPGNSGGPVILKPETTALTGTKAVNKAYLIGVVRAYIPYQEVAISAQTNRTRIVFEDNSGLAEVVPIDRVQECIEASSKPG
jgi:S1-C subfamily serine protease